MSVLITNINEKMNAIRTAVDCIHTVNSFRPGEVTNDVLRLLADLRMDLLDIQDAQAEAEASKERLIRAMETGGYNDNGPAPIERRGAPYDSRV